MFLYALSTRRWLIKFIHYFEFVINDNDVWLKENHSSHLIKGLSSDGRYIINWLFHVILIYGRITDRFTDLLYRSPHVIQIITSQLYSIGCDNLKFNKVAFHRNNISPICTYYWWSNKNGYVEMISPHSWIPLTSIWGKYTNSTDKIDGYIVSYWNL